MLWPCSSDYIGSGYEDIVNSLLMKGADVNAQGGFYVSSAMLIVSSYRRLYTGYYVLEKEK
jgi:hypothetical protein